MTRIQSIEALEAANRRERATDEAALWLALAEATGPTPGARRVHRAKIAPASALEAPAPRGPSLTPPVNVWDRPGPVAYVGHWRPEASTFLGPREGVWTRAGRRPSVIRVEAAIKAAREIIGRTGGASVGRRYSPAIALERLLALQPDELAYYTAATFDGWTHDAWRGYRGGAPTPGDCWGRIGEAQPVNHSEAAREARREAARFARARQTIARMTPEQVERRRALKRAAEARRRERAGAAGREAEAARKRESRALAGILGNEAGRE